MKMMNTVLERLGYVVWFRSGYCKGKSTVYYERNI